jgi:hypothetical protein
MALILIIFSILAIVDFNPFRSSLFSPYEGDQGIAPFQELINYVNQEGPLPLELSWTEVRYQGIRPYQREYPSLSSSTSSVQELHRLRSNLLR